MNNITKLQGKWKPRTKTGKTRFNREKKHGESWTALRSAEMGEGYVCKEAWIK